MTRKAVQVETVVPDPRSWNRYRSKDHLTVAEVAYMADVSLTAIYSAIKSGRLDCSRFGSVTLIPKLAAKEYVKRPSHQRIAKR